MARKATTTNAASSKTTTSKKAGKTSAETLSSESDHAQAAYFNWLGRGAPLWDDQRDWFSVKKGS